MADNTNAPLSLYCANVMHRKHFPRSYRFNYRVFSFLVDIDALDAAERASLSLPKIAHHTFVSHNAFNLFSLYTKDHGARDGSDWREWINALLDAHQLSNAKHRIQLLCFPRVLGFTFNPLSLWYCYGADGALYAVVCEVSNTFGEHHHYVLHNHNQPYSGAVTGRKRKIFHVSPFIDMNAEYDFSLHPPDEQLRIVINEYQDKALMLTATQIGELRLATNRNLLIQFFKLPFMTLKIVLMIHWQALKIWLRGGKYHKKPEPPKNSFS